MKPNRIAVFADVQNVYYTTRDTYRRSFDYQKFWNKLSTEGEIVSAHAYATHRGDDGQHRFQTALRSIGFTVKLKPYIKRSDGSSKGDWDVGITVDALDVGEAVDTVVLLSGDGDFDLLLLKLKKRHGINTWVYGVPGLTSQNLINAADRFVPIDEHFLL